MKAGWLNRGTFQYRTREDPRTALKANLQVFNFCFNGDYLESVSSFKKSELRLALRFVLL
jgi:hypothetical protein